MHALVLDELTVLLTIGRESHAAVEEHFQIGPHLVDGTLASDFQRAVEHRHHP